MPVINNIPTTQYIGPKIIPHLWDPILWDSTIQYDALAVVQYNGAGYISRFIPPIGTNPSDTEYWVKWSDFNAQLAQVQQQVQSLANSIDGKVSETDFQNAVDAINAAIAQKADTTALESAVETINNTLAQKADTTSVDAVQSQIDDVVENIETIETNASNKTRLQNLINISANYAPWKLIDTFRTYMPHSSEFHYGAGSILKYDYDEAQDIFTPASLVGRYVNSIPTFGMSCAPTVELALMGIPYETSRMSTGNITGGTTPTLTGGQNTPVSGASCIDIFDKLIHNNYSESDYVTYASELAKWLNDAGFLHKRKLMDSVVEFAPGDIIFDVTHPVDDDIYWNGIGHVGIYCGPWYSGGIVAETANDTIIYQIRTKSAASLSNTTYYARIPMPGNDIVRNLVADRFPMEQYPNGYSYENVSGIGTAHALRFDLSAKYKLKKNYIYTCVMKLTNIVGTNVRVAVNGYDYTQNNAYPAIVGNINTGNPACYLGDDWYYGVVMTPNEMPSNNIDGIYFRPNADSSTYSVNIENIAFYDRMIMPSIGNEISV